MGTKKEAAPRPASNPVASAPKTKPELGYFPLDQNLLDGAVLHIA